MPEIKEGDKVRVLGGDQNIVKFNPFGVIRDIKPNGMCSVVLNYGKGPNSIVTHVQSIGPLTANNCFTGYTIALYEWSMGEDSLIS